MPLRHRCPACGGPPAFRQDFGSGRKSVPWYKFIPVRLFCTTCRAEVQGVLSPRVWPVLFVWIVLVLGAFWGLVELRDSQAVSVKTFQVAGLALAFTVWAGGMQMFRFFLEYKVVAPEA